jgi:hypothetical protein
METQVLEKAVHQMPASIAATVNNPAGTTANSSSNRPEDRPQQPRPSDVQSRNVVRERCSGAVSITLAGGFPRIAKCVDVSAIGMSVHTELPIAMSKVYDLQIKAFRNGQNFEFSTQAVCVHCTLSGRDFRAGFKFGPMSDKHRAVLDALLQN